MSINMPELPKVETVKEKKIYRGLYEFVVILRILVPVTLFKFPFFGFIGSLFLDGIDAELASHRILSQRHYEIVDKFLDFWWYCVVYLYIVLHNADFIWLMAFLLIFRAIGDTFYLLKKDRKYLFFFPNFYENVFILIFLGTNIPLFKFLIVGKAFYVSLIGVFILKILQEYWLHVINGSVSEKLFGLKKNWLK